MDARAIQRAQRKLELRDIVLHTSSLKRERDDEVDPSLYPISVEQKSEVLVTVDRVSFRDREGLEVDVLRVFVHLMVAGLPWSEADAGAPPLFSIQSVYRVDYAERERLTREELATFSQYNSVHNVWPFWRQHVSDVVSRASLPRITIPFFRAIPGEPRPRRSTRNLLTTKVSQNREGASRPNFSRRVLEPPGDEE